MKNKSPKSPWVIFALVAVAQFMVVLDSAIANVALPAIQKSLGFDTASLQWVVTAYALAFGGFLLLGGRAADLFGRRKMLLIGMIAFTVLSLLIGLSTSAVAMVVLRALQGIAAAFMSPAALSIVLTTFKEGKNRTQALGLWSTVATGGAAVGLLLGGVLTEYLNWRWNFFVNVPVGIAIVVAVLKLMPADTKQTSPKGLDIVGAGLVTTGLISVVYAINLAATLGLTSVWTIGTALLGVALLIGFVRNESRVKHPLMPLNIFKVRNVAGANPIIAMVIAGMFSMFFLVSLYVQEVLHYSSVATGLSFLPFPIILGVLSSAVTPRLMGRFGYKRLLIVGPLIAALGLAWLTRLPVEGQYFTDILPAMVFIAVGVSMTFTPLFVAATSGVRADESGLSSGLINTSQQMGGALGLTIMSGIAASVAAMNIGAGKLAATVYGYNRAFLISTILMIVASIVGAVVIKEKRRAPNEQRAPVVVTE